MRLGLIVGFSCVLLTFAPGNAYAAEPVVTNIEVGAPQDLTVGDHVHYVVTLEADAGTTLAIAGGSLPPELELVSQPETRERRLDGARVEISLSFEAAAFAPGEIAVPAIRLGYRSPDGRQGQVLTPPTSLSVRSVLPTSGAIEPRDLKPQVEIGSAPASPVLPAVVAIAVLSLAAAFAWSKMRRRPLDAPAAAIDVELGPEDRAKRVLDGLAGALVQGDYAGYYAGLSETVRSYLSERFGFPAYALTSSELRERMVHEGMDRWQARLVSGLLSECDSVVYAQYRPALERAEADLDDAYEIVELSRSAPLVVEGAPA